MKCFAVKCSPTQIDLTEVHIQQKAHYTQGLPVTSSWSYADKLHNSTCLRVPNSSSFFVNIYLQYLFFQNMCTGVSLVCRLCEGVTCGGAGVTGSWALVLSQSGRGAVLCVVALLCTLPCAVLTNKLTVEEKATVVNC